MRKKFDSGGVFIFIIIVVLSKIFFQLIGLSNAFLNDNTIVFFLIFGLLLLSTTHPTTKIEPIFLSIALLVIVTMIFSVGYQGSSTGSFMDLVKLMVSYGTVFVVLIVASFGLYGIFNKSNAFIKVFMYFIFIQATLVIIQHVKKNPIFDIVNSEGNVITGPIVYFSGGSTRNLDLLKQVGYSLRGFGMMNSGLSAGLILLLAIAILWNQKTNIYWKIMATFFLGTAVTFTITRIVWVTAFIVLIGYVITVIVNSYKPILIFSKVMIISNSIFIIIFNGLEEFSTNNPTLQTLISRLDGFRFFLQEFPIKWSNFLQGQNFAARRLDLATLYNPDNEILFNLLSIGVIGTVAITATYFLIINKILFRNPSNDDFVLAKTFLILGYSVVGFGNFSSFNFFGFLLIISLISQVKERSLT